MIEQRDYAAEMEEIVLPALHRCVDEGYMEPAVEDAEGEPLHRLNHPGTLHYLCYDHRKFAKLDIPGASRTFHGAVVISHGFSEFAVKYQEMAWYFLLAGYSVCVFEHRGHGYSARDVSARDVLWIDDWRRYVADLAKFASTVGHMYADEHQLALFAHSMGAGISAALLERYPAVFDKAVLSSPMIEASTGVPTWLASGICGLLGDLGRSKSPAPGQHPFNAELSMKHYPGGSEERVRWFRDQRVADQHYQTSQAANGWVKQAVRLSRAILQEGATARISTPILLFQSTNDTWVHNAAQDRFVEQVATSGGDIRMHHVEACHEIFAMPNETMAPYLKKILRFLVSGEKVSVLP